MDCTTLPFSPIADSSLLSALFMLGRSIVLYYIPLSCSGLTKQNTTLSSTALPAHWSLLPPYDYLAVAPDYPRSNPQPCLGGSRGMGPRHERANSLGTDSLCAHWRHVQRHQDKVRGMLGSLLISRQLMSTSQEVFDRIRKSHTQQARPELTPQLFYPLLSGRK